MHIHIPTRNMNEYPVDHQGMGLVWGGRDLISNLSQENNRGLSAGP